MRDLNELFANLDFLQAPDVREEARRRLADPDKPTPPLRGGRAHRAIVIAVAFLVFIPAAALAWRAVRATSPRPGASVTPSQTTQLSGSPSPMVYFAWVNEVTSIDATQGIARTYKVPELAAGDPEVYLARIGGRLAFWGYDIYTLDPLDLAAPSQRIAHGSWFFVPSATPGRIWVVWKDDKASTPYHFVFDHLREIDSDGTVIVDGTAPGDGWLDGAVSAGPIFNTRDGLIVWDPVAGKVIARLEASSSAATFENTVVWCDNHCPQLHFTEVLMHAERTTDPPSGYVAFNAWSGVFSPDGATFAVPVWSTPTGRAGTNAVALIDVATGRVTGLVPGSETEAGCCMLSWDSTGQRLYIGRYETGKTEAWRLSYWDISASSTVEVPVVVPRGLAMVAG